MFVSRHAALWNDSACQFCVKRVLAPGRCCGSVSPHIIEVKYYALRNLKHLSSEKKNGFETVKVEQWLTIPPAHFLLFL